MLHKNNNLDLRMDLTCHWQTCLLYCCAKNCESETRYAAPFIFYVNLFLCESCGIELHLSPFLVSSFFVAITSLLPLLLLLSACAAGLEEWIRPLNMGPDDTHISYLPLAHVFEQSVCGTVLAHGAKIGFYQVSFYPS